MDYLHGHVASRPRPWHRRCAEVRVDGTGDRGWVRSDAHGFPTSRGPIVHGGAIATIADEALASVAFTHAEEGETTVTADLKVDFLRPAKPGRLVARATLRHRTKRLAFCETTVEQGDGKIVADARPVIAYVKA